MKFVNTFMTFLRKFMKFIIIMKPAHSQRLSFRRHEAFDASWAEVVRSHLRRRQKIGRPESREKVGRQPAEEEIN